MSARVYDGDATRSTVELAVVTDDPGNTGAITNGGGFTRGRNVWVNVSPTVTDPASNTLNTSNNINIRSGIAQ